MSLNEPPAHLKDPVVLRQRVQQRAKWTRANRGRIPADLDQIVALRLCDWGDRDGGNCHPGVPLLAKACLKSEKSIKRSIAWLDEHGWITCMQKAVPKAHKSAVWALTIPAPVAVELGIWEGDPDLLWTERPAGMAKRPGMRDRPAPRKPGPKPRARTEPPPVGNLLLPGQETFLGVTNSGLKGSRTHVLGVTNSVSRGHECHLEERSEEFLGVNNSISRGHLDDPPPGPTTPGPKKNPPDFVGGPTRQRGGSGDDLDEDREVEDLLASVLSEAERRIGFPLHPNVAAMIEGMLIKGCHPHFVVNAAVKQEQEAWGA